MTKHAWISSEGGPLILMHRSQLRTWHGAAGKGRDEHGFETDYDWACSVEEEVAVYEGPSQMLVLGDEPDATSLRSIGADIVLVRWRAAPSAESMEDALARRIGDLRFEPIARFTTRPGEHLLFDSADVGWDANPALVATLDGHTYEVANAMLTAEEGISALLHRLVKVA
jgi:hypothetical protein